MADHRKQVIAAIFAVALLTALLASAGGDRLVYVDEDGRTEVSIVRLLADPDKFHGKRVRVSGFMTVGFENNALYLSSLDYEWGITSNALALEISEVAPALKKVNRKYVSLVATFDANGCGHLCLFSGSLKNVSEISSLTRTSRDAVE